MGRSLLRDDVYPRLRDAIVDGTFAPGESLRDGELAEWLGVSRGALVRASGNPSIAAVLEQFEPVVRRAEFLRFVSIDRFAARERHAVFIDLCEAGDAEGAADLAFQTWHGLPVAVPGQGAE